MFSVIPSVLLISQVSRFKNITVPYFNTWLGGKEIINEVIVHFKEPRVMVPVGNQGEW